MIDTVRSRPCCEGLSVEVGRDEMSLPQSTPLAPCRNTGGCKIIVIHNVYVGEINWVFKPSYSKEQNYDRFKVV